MLASITPLGERGRNRRWGPTVGAYVAGSSAGGLALGALAGLAGWALGGVPGAARAALFAAGALGGLAVDLRHRLPSWRRQVDETWLTEYRGWVCGVGYGTQLGFAVATIVPSSTTYAALLLAVLAGSPLVGVAIGVAFGAARALPVLAMRRVTEPAVLRATHRRLARWARPAAAAAVAAQGTAAVVVLALGVAR